MLTFQTCVLNVVVVKAEQLLYRVLCCLHVPIGVHVRVFVNTFCQDGRQTNI